MTKRFAKKMLLFLILSAVLITAAAAEDKNIFETYDDALGGFFGPITGSGLSYQHWFGDFGIQTAAVLLYYPEDPGSNAYSPYSTVDPVDVDEFTYQIGVGLQYMLYDDSYGDWFDGCLYLFLGGMHTGAIRTTYYYEEVTVETFEEYPLTGQSGPVYVPGMAAGFGFGFELVFFDHFSIPFEIGISGTWEWGSVVPVDAGLKPQMGFRYRF